MLPVIYQGEELNFPMTVYRSAFGFRITVVVDGIELFFERDEEMKLRGLISTDNQAKDKEISPGLFDAIATSLQAVFS